MHDGEQNTGKRTQIPPLQSDALEFLRRNTLLTLHPIESDEPPDKERKTPEEVLACSRSQLSVRIVRMALQQPHGKGLRLTDRGEALQLALLHKCHVVGAES